MPSGCWRGMVYRSVHIQAMDTDHQHPSTKFPIHLKQPSVTAKLWPMDSYYYVRCIESRLFQSVYRWLFLCKFNYGFKSHEPLVDFDSAVTQFLNLAIETFDFIGQLEDIDQAR